MAEEINVTIVKVVSPVVFEALLNPEKENSVENSATHCDFNALSDNINSYYCQYDVLSDTRWLPKRDQLVVVRHRRDRKWYRALVKSIIERSHGYDARLYCVDIAEDLNVPISHVRQIHEAFAKLPFRAVRLELPNLSPASIFIKDDFSVEHRTADKWDTSAEEFVKRNLRSQGKTVFKVLKIGRCGSLIGNLHLFNKNEQICLNKLLVENNFAVMVDANDSTSHSLDDNDCFVETDDDVPFGATASNYSHSSVEYSTSSSPFSLTKKTRSKSSASEEQEWRDLNISLLQKKVDDLINGSNEISTTDKPCHFGVQDKYSGFSCRNMNKIRSFSDKTDVSSSSSCESFRHSRMDDDVRRSRDFGRSCIPHNSFHSLTNDDNTTIKTSDNMNGFEKLKPESSKKLYCSSSETGVLKDVNDCNRLVEQERQYTSNTITKNLNKQNALEANESTASASSTTSENIGDCKSESSSFSVAKRKLLLNRLNNGPSFLNESGKLSKGDDRCTSVQSVSTSDNSMKDQVLPCTSTDSDVHPQLSPTIESSSLSSGALKVPKETTNSLLKEFLRRHCVKADSNSKSKGLESNNNSSSYSTGSSLTVKKDCFATHSARHKLHFFEITAASPYFSTSMDDPLGIAESVAGKKILTYGHASPKPCFDLSLSLHPFILGKLRRLNVLTPSVLQSYVWPAMLRGRSFAAISSPHSGKTLAYLCPLLTFLLEKSQYVDLPSGNEPHVLIVTASWKTATRIYDQCKAILRDDQSVKVLLVYGGAREESQKISLWNGSDILIATPCAVVRLLKGEGIKPLNLNRLCHLVLDNADILIEQFIDQIKEILVEYENVLKKRKLATVPYQIVAFSCKWTLGLKSLLRNIMPNPLLYCSSFCESVIIAGVKATCTVFEESRKSTNLLELLQPNLKRNNERIVICACDANSANELFKTLPPCPWLLLATELMAPCEVLGVRNFWHQCNSDGQKPILVVSDACLDELNIENADHLIHYDIPEMSKSQFGLRFSCLLNHMKEVNVIDCVTKNSSSMTSCQVLIIITEKCRLQAHGLIKLLTRLSSNIPTELVSLALGLYHASEENKELYSLCHYIKAFGKCPKQYWCSRRHLLTESMDKPSTTILRGCLVKVYITDVRNASHFYGRIIEYQTEDGIWVPSHLNFISLNLNLNLYFANPNNRLRHNQPKIGEICAIVGKDSCYYRVRVLSRPQRKVGNNQLVRVICIDVGTLHSVGVDELLKLPSNLLSTPPIAVEMYLCNVRPIDMDQEWTSLACEEISSLIFGHCMVGKVTLTLGNTLWLSSLIKKTTLQCSSIVVKNFELKEILLKRHFAMDNPTHLQSLEALAKKTFTLQPIVNPSQNSIITCTNSHSSSMKLPPDFAYLKIGEFHDVTVSELFTPCKFFVTRSDSNKCLDNLMDDIQEYIKTGPSHSRRISEGMLCIAKFPKTDEYYRGRIIKGPSERGVVNVFYVDYGYEAEVDTTDIYSLVEKYMWRLPFQAIACSLADVIPIDESKGWSKEAADCMWDETSTEDGMVKEFVIKALKKTDEVDPKTGLHCYEVQLFDGSKTHGDVQISARLSNLGYAKFLDKKEIHEEIKIEEVVDLREDKPVPCVQDSIKVLPDNVKKTVPYVTWVDFKSSIELKLKLRNVKEFSVKITSQHLYFETSVNNNIYELNIDLFSAVDEEKSKTKICEGWVLITLIKLVSIYWPRLLKQTLKPFWLTVDYDKVDYDQYDSDSSPKIDWQRFRSSSSKENGKRDIGSERKLINPDVHERECSLPLSHSLSTSTDCDESCGSSTFSDSEDHCDIFS